MTKKPIFIILNSYKNTGDNIIAPGSPDYLAYFIDNNNYDSVLEHSYVEYCDIPDAILFSERIT